MDRARKRELRALNTRAWDGDIDGLVASASLDSSMKKNTAFIKRLRTAITQASVNTFVQEIRTLSLTKYLSEIVSASFEGLVRLKTPAEIAAGVEVVSALHQRFGPSDYTSYLGWLIGRGLAPPDRVQLKQLPQETRDKEEKERLSRQRVLLKLVTDLWLVDVLRSLDDVKRPEDATARAKDAAKVGDASTKAKANPQVGKAEVSLVAEPFPLEVLKELLGYDKDLTNLPLAVLFVKTFAWDILGVQTTPEEQKTVDADGSTRTLIDALTPVDNFEAGTSDNFLTTPELRQRFRNVFEKYFDDVKQAVVKAQKAINSQKRRNDEAYVKSGEVFEDRQANFAKQEKSQEKLVLNAQVLAEILGMELPDLKEKDAADPSGVPGIGLVKTADYLRGQSDGAGIWEDEDERRFYENIIDVKDRVPNILLEENKKRRLDGDDQVGKRTEQNPSAEIATKDGDEKLTKEADEQSMAIANKTVGAQVDALLARLPELQSKDAVDQIAVDFCFVNSKASRNRLIKAVQEVPKGRSDLFPLFSRLVATLGKYLPDISSGLVSYLDDEFRSLQRRKSKEFLGKVRTGNIRYIAELTKFGVVPEHVVFHCLKVSVDDFSRMNIEIIGNLLENCGRYLLRNPSTAPRMKTFLETLQRKKAAQHLGQQERMLIENAVYYVNPPERAAIEQKERTPVDLYVRKLIYLDLNKRTYTRILKTIRKLHWEETEVVEILFKIFTKPAKVKYSNVHFLALLLAALYRYHQAFVISVIDDLLERVTLGLEQNDFRSNQRRLAEVKYLGELYNYKMVDSPVIFDTLYRIVTFGHPNGTPLSGRTALLDMPDDYFRIRLVCCMLETCGVCFDRGAAKKKLDFFLTFFQYYITTKDPLPMDIDFVIQDTFAVTRPQWKLVTDPEVAGKAFADAVAQNYKTQEADKVPEPEEPEDDGSSGDDGEEDGLQPPDAEDEQSSGEDVDTEPLTNGINKPDFDYDEDIVVTRKEEERDPEADADFDKEYAKMMAESLDSRKSERKPMFDVPLPMKRAQRDLAGGADDHSAEPISPTPMKMAFSLMTKKGNRQQTRTIELASDSDFAVAMKNQKEAARAEQQRIKNLVLNYDLQDSSADQSDGKDLDLNSQYFSQPNPNLPKHYPVPLLAQDEYHRSAQYPISKSWSDLQIDGTDDKNGNGNIEPNDFSYKYMRTPAYVNHDQGFGSFGATGDKNHYNPSLNNNSSQQHQSPPGQTGTRAVEKVASIRGQRARKLQLSDVDWYDQTPEWPSLPSSSILEPSHLSLAASFASSTRFRDQSRFGRFVHGRGRRAGTRRGRSSRRVG
ncbi:hypothetical protein MMC25_007603 [Agyrium rufum]|nr:hypothetical protein [Agyrium rufum]